MRNTMQPLHQTIQVTYHYTVHFTRQLFTHGNLLLKETILSGGSKNILCVVDHGVAQHHPTLLEDIEGYCRRHHLALVCPPLVVDGGEHAKNDRTNVVAIQEAIHRYGLCRHSYVITLGGGAVLDMAGYAAATAHRGIRLIRVPTTVLSQNDSGVGVKNGINAFGKKNFLGTFTPPVAVFNDADFLIKLPDRDWRSGVSEAIKVALLKDSTFFSRLEQQAPHLIERDLPTMLQVIRRCAQLHLDHIATGGDPFESSSSRPLDFGHWAAHKLENLSGYTLRHGEAVAIGIALDSTYAYLTGLLPEADWQRILALFSALHLATYSPELSEHLLDSSHPRCLLTGLQEFREHLGGELTVYLLTGIGQGIEVHEIDEDTMRASVALLANDPTQESKNAVSSMTL